MVAEVGAEVIHEEVGIGFVVAEDLLYAVLKGNGAEVDVFGIVLLDGGKPVAVDIADFHLAGEETVVAVGIALYVLFKFHGNGAGGGEGIGDGGFAVLGENAIEVLHLLDEGVLLGDPDGVREVGADEGVGEGGGFGSHGFGFLSVLLNRVF